MLQRFRPHFYLPPGHRGPVDFYRDYVANAVLLDGQGRIVANGATRAALNTHKTDPGAQLIPRQPPTASPRPVAKPVRPANVAGRSIAAVRPHTVYARSFRVQLSLLPQTPSLGSATAQPNARAWYRLLQYHLVFRVSGLPAGLPRPIEWLLSTLIDLDDWHQLDHYTAVTLVFGPDEATDSGRAPLDAYPLAMVLQQHNYHHTYLLGEAVPVPANGRVEVDVAIRSNELFPHTPHRTQRRAVRFADVGALDFLISGEDGPWISANDITHGVFEMDYRLEFLPADDAFYQFQGYLGERRCAARPGWPAGRGVQYLAAVEALGCGVVCGYWREGSEGDRKRLELNPWPGRFGRFRACAESYLRGQLALPTAGSG